MYSVMRLSGRLLAMKTVDCLEEFGNDDEALAKVQTFIDEGTPVVFCEDLIDLYTLFIKPEEIEIVEPE